MRPILRYTLLLALIICFITCKKDNGGSSATLPEATQEGKNTMGMKVNGEVWTTYYTCGSYSNPCGAISVNYNQSGSPAYYLNMKFRNTKNELTSFNITSIYDAVGIKTVGNKYDSVIVFYSKGFIDYGKSYKPKGSFTITKLDLTNQIIAGKFEMTLYNGGDSIIITDGRFDCKFYTCLCN